MAQSKLAAQELLSHLELDIPFRGDRPYLHSTHILAAIVQHLPIRGPIKLEFRKMVHHPVVISAHHDSPQSQVGSFSFFDEGVWHRRGLFIRPEASVSRRVPCNENEITSLYDKGLDAGEGEIGAPGSMIETIVALNKSIVSRHTAKGGKIIFSAVKLDGYPKNGIAKVALSRSLGETLFISDIFWNGQNYGSLTFMVV